MNALLAIQLPSSLSAIRVVLQGAGLGSLIAAGVLVRARLRGLEVQPWAVTATWSLLGAMVVAAVLGAVPLTGAGQRSMPKVRPGASRSWARPRSRATCARSRETSIRRSGSRTSSGNARRGSS